MATISKYWIVKIGRKKEGRYKGKEKGNMQETDVRIKTEATAPQKKCTFVQNVYHKFFDSWKIRT